MKMTTAQVVETSVTVTNSSFQNYTHPDDHTTRTTDTPGFKPFTILQLQARIVRFWNFRIGVCGTSGLHSAVRARSVFCFIPSSQILQDGKFIPV